MEPARWNIRVRQGTSYSLPFTVDDDGVLWNLTGWTARMQVRPFTESTKTILSLTDTAGITLGGVAGSVTVALTNVQTSALPVGTHKYDLELVSPGGLVYPLLEGKFRVDPEVTR